MLKKAYIDTAPDKSKSATGSRFQRVQNLRKLLQDSGIKSNGSNCVQACLQTIFQNLSVPGPPAVDLWSVYEKNLQAWLRKHGYTMEEYTGEPPDEIVMLNDDEHCVVGFGNQVIWDPDPKEDFEPVSYFVFRRI